MVNLLDRPHWDFRLVSFGGKGRGLGVGNLLDRHLMGFRLFFEGV